jgi:gamma-D-glutamyl-L-lysine dipeptidyl-peptidase
MTALTFGVSRLNIIPVRSEASDKAELVTQLLFGDHYEVLENSADKKWNRIRVFADHYEGWIDRKQHHDISQDYFDYLNRAEFKITTDITTSILFNKNPLTIVIGSVIPISSSELFKMEEQYAFNGEAKNIGQKREFEFLKSIAFKYLYAPYLWGGKTPFGIDCSGLTQMVFRICGYNLLRDAWQQAGQGKVVNNFREGVAGDLAFFKNGEGKITHVGIVLPDGRILHASGRVRVDRLTEDGIFQLDNGEKTHTFSHLRRILTDA